MNLVNACMTLLVLTNIFLSCTGQDETTGEHQTGDLLMEARIFPVEEDTTSLEPTLLDFRYKPGARTRLPDMPTSFGPMDLDLQISRNGRTASLFINPPQSAFARKRALNKIVIHLENFGRTIKAVRYRDNPISGEHSIPARKSFTLSIRSK